MSDLEGCTAVLGDCEMVAEQFCLLGELRSVLLKLAAKLHFLPLQPLRVPVRRWV
jgi:hypothetical protein